MKKLMSDRGTSFDITKVREGESDCKNGKVDTRCMWKTLTKWMKNHGLSKGWKTLRRGNSCTIRVFFLKRETLSPTFVSYQLSTLFLKDLLGILP